MTGQIEATPEELDGLAENAFLIWYLKYARDLTDRTTWVEVATAAWNAGRQYERGE